VSLANRFYDRIRSSHAGAVATQSPVEGPLPDTQYVVVATYKRDGTAVPTPVWAALDGDRLVFRTEADTAKVMRLRHTPRVRVAPSNVRGKPTGPPVEGVARIVGPSDDAGEAALARKYGRQRAIYEKVAPHGDLVYVEIRRA
jgi:hypothetical protein